MSKPRKPKKKLPTLDDVCGCASGGKFESIAIKTLDYHGLIIGTASASPKDAESISFVSGAPGSGKATGPTASLEAAFLSCSPGTIWKLVKDDTPHDPPTDVNAGS